MPERQALLDAAVKLEQAAKDLGDKFEAVDLFAHETAKAHRRTRDLTYWLIAGLLTQLVIIIVLGFVMVRANDANSRSQRNAEYDIASCKAGNDFRAGQLRLWASNAELVRAGGGKGARVFADKLMANAAENLKPRDCSKVSEGKVR